jgi:hypothetical protein
MQKFKEISVSLKENFALGVMYLLVGLVISAFLLQISMVYLELSGNKEAVRSVVNWFNTKFDGRFKNDPASVWYTAEDHIWVESVTNEVKIGKLAGNRNLAFGVKNTIEEFLQEKGYDLSPTAPYKLQVQIVYLDVLTTKKNVSVFHKNEEEVVIRMKGVLYKDGKKEKEMIVEESSSEISMSTLIVDEGGQFNQTSLSNALKKSADKLITKLFNK